MKAEWIRVKVDAEVIDRVLDDLKPKRIGVAAPDGLLSAAKDLYRDLKSRGYEVVLLLDPTYGICDLQDEAADGLELDVAINLGHHARKVMAKRTILVNAEYIIGPERLDDLTKIVAARLRELGWRRIGVYTINNYRSSLRYFLRKLADEGVNIAEYGPPSPMSPMEEWQVIGCNFERPWRMRGDVEGYVFLGGGSFHAIGIRLSTGKRTLVADPELLQVRDVEGEAVDIERRALMAIYKARDARRIGIITGLKSGQRFLKLARNLARSLEMFGKDTMTIALTEIDSSRLNLLHDMDALIVLACPRVPFDVAGVHMPILSYPQAIALMRILRGEDIGHVFNIPVWAWTGYGRERP